MAKKNKKHPQEETELLEEQPAQQDDVSGAQRPRRQWVTSGIRRALMPIIRDLNIGC